MAFLLAACGSPSGDRACEETYTNTITAVDGVESVEADCSSQFGGGWQRVTVNLTASTDEEARPIIDAIESALADEPEIKSEWATPNSYILADGTDINVSTYDVGVLRDEG
jgi:copper chaperone CopZ